MNKCKKRLFRRMLIVLAVLAALAAFFIWQNNDIVITGIEYTNEKVPGSFDGFRILQVSDLHSKVFGQSQEKLLKLTAACRPDVIVITGDLIDGHSMNMEAGVQYAQAAGDIAPVCFVSGNHEWLSGQYGELCKSLEKAGVTVLDNKHIALARGADSVELLGLKDSTFEGDEEFRNELKTLADETSGFRILLSHHTEYIGDYAENGIELVLSGHAHGGQIRLLFIGGLFAPGQGFFPRYTSGLYVVENTSMVVSRGLGNSDFPLRVFNRPELVLVTLRTR